MSTAFLILATDGLVQSADESFSISPNLAHQYNHQPLGKVSCRQLRMSNHRRMVQARQSERYRYCLIVLPQDLQILH